MTRTESEAFAVYCAGETIDGTEIGITYIYATTPLGRVRMTADEAEELGCKLIAAARYDRELNDEEHTPSVGKRYRLTRAHLEDVAAVYREALENGAGPTRAVANHFDVSHSTAAKWVGKARRHGALRSTTKGVAR